MSRVNAPITIILYMKVVSGLVSQKGFLEGKLGEMSQAVLPFLLFSDIKLLLFEVKKSDEFILKWRPCLIVAKTLNVPCFKGAADTCPDRRTGGYRCGQSDHNPTTV